MSKGKKAFIISLICVIVVLLATLGTFYFIFPKETVEFLKSAWHWANDPLPVVGVSVLMVLTLFWRIFASSSFGRKQINEFKRLTNNTIGDFNSLKADYEHQLKEAEKLLKEYEEKLESLKQFVEQICEKSRNAQIKKLGETLYGKETKETVNNETETN